MRHFTPEEANAELEHVRPLVEQLVATRQEHAAALERQEALEGKIRGNGGGIPPATLAAAAADVEEEARTRKSFWTPNRCSPRLPLADSGTLLSRAHHRCLCSPWTMVNRMKKRLRL